MKTFYSIVEQDFAGPTSGYVPILSNYEDKNKIVTDFVICLNRYLGLGDSAALEALSAMHDTGTFAPSLTRKCYTLLKHEDLR